MGIVGVQPMARLQDRAGRRGGRWALRQVAALLRGRAVPSIRRMHLQVWLRRDAGFALG
jgi:hypothetical protein